MTIFLSLLAVLSSNVPDSFLGDRICDAGHKQIRNMAVTRDIEQVLRYSVGTSFPQIVTCSWDHHAYVAIADSEISRAQEKVVSDSCDDLDSNSANVSSTRYVDLTSMRDQVRSLRFNGVLLPMFPEVTDGPYGVTITPVTCSR